MDDRADRQCSGWRLGIKPLPDRMLGIGRPSEARLTRGGAAVSLILMVPLMGMRKGMRCGSPDPKPQLPPQL